MAQRIECKVSVVMVMAFLILFFYSPAGAKTSYYSGSPMSGSQVFFEKGCVRCHSILGVGGKIGPDLGRVKLNYSFFGIASIMWNHAPKMLNKFASMDISFPKFSTEEMNALITFLSYLNYLERPSDFNKGRELFREKSCIKCHSVGGKGGDVGPALDRFRPYQSPIFITTAFWNKAPEMARSMLDLNIKRPQFKDNEIMDIMAFIRQDALVKDGEYKRIYAPPGNPERGLTLMKEKNCLRCHSIHGKGGTIGPDLGNSKLRLSFTQIAGRMWNHAPTMWKVMAKENIPIPKFSETEMSDILSYIYLAAIQEKGGNPLNGKLLLQEKGCNNCHPIAGKGGVADLVAPDFVEKAAELKLNSPTKVVTEMWNHIQPMGKRVEEMGMTWPTISAHEISDITAYLVSLANKPKP